MSVELSARSIRVSTVEWPTLCLIAVTLGAWLALVALHAQLPWPLLMLAAACVLCLHGSLQHESIHGHPTRWRCLNAWLVAAPLSLWIPYSLYRASHLRHHQVKALTCPHIDPESFYVNQATWQQLPAVWRLVLSVNQTLVGRVVIGPALVIGQFYVAWLRGKFSSHENRAMWRHCITVAVLLLAMYGLVDLTPLKYFFLFVYPALSLTLVRSFVEHQPVSTGRDTTTIVNSQSLLSLLFLNNNLHWLHHRDPGRPWYELRGEFHALRNRLPDDVTVYDGYGEVVRRFMFHRRDRAWQE